jgi:uncharacterized protein (TIGR00730 family)
VFDKPPGAPRVVNVFCGASNNAKPAFISLARAFGGACADRGVDVVYGGCRTGLMGALADGALARGGRVTGVLPSVLLDREPGHAGLTSLERVDDMAVRKLRMAALSTAFVALPGGYGTLDELFEVLTLRMIGAHQKPIALLNADGFYDDLLRFLDRAAADGVLSPVARSFLIVGADPGALLDALWAAPQLASV